MPRCHFENNQNLVPWHCFVQNKSLVSSWGWISWPWSSPNVARPCFDHECLVNFAEPPGGNEKSLKLENKQNRKPWYYSFIFQWYIEYSFCRKSARCWNIRKSHSILVGQNFVFKDYLYLMSLIWQMELPWKVEKLQCMLKDPLEGLVKCNGWLYHTDVKR